MPVQRGSRKCDVQKERYDPLNELSSNQRSQASACSGSEHHAKTPRPAAVLRPKPRPALKGPSRKLQEFPSMPPLGESDAEDKRKGNHHRSVPSDETSTTSRKGEGNEKQTEDPFTALSPLSVKKQDILAHRKSSSKEKIATSFPCLSPLPSPAHKDSLQSSKRREKYPRKSRKRRTVVVSSSEDHTDDEAMSSNYKVRPFPMETQILESIGHSPGTGVSGDDSDGTLDNDLTRKRKKRRANPDELLAELLHTDGTSDFDEEAFLFLNPNIDPKLLCPWCDEMLPPAPSPHLMSLMAMARKVSWLDPRPTNSHGIRAPLGAFVGVCQRHRFENHHIPLAQQRGWPMQIDWDRVGPRVEALKPRLDAIVDDVDEDFQPGASHKGLGDDDQEDPDDEGQWTNRPRKGSVLWRDVVKSVKKKGSRQTASVSGQFTNFSKSQPGYYGELGHVIIHQTIYNLFPPASFSPDSTLPLTPTDFIQIILVPEAAISLIMEDLNQTREEAIETLRESAEYGVDMFSDDHAEGVGAVDAGNQIIRERARARRKELEEEERIEEEIWGAQGDANSSQPQEKGNRNVKSRKAESESGGHDTQWSDSRWTKKSGRKPTAKSSRRGRSKTACSDADTESDVIMVSDTGTSTSGRATRTRSTAGAQARSTSSRPKSKASSVATLSDIEIDPREDNALKPPPRPRPRRKGQEPTSSQSNILDKEKENLPTRNKADCDVPEITASPTTSQSVYRPVETRSERARRSSEMSNVEATPRPDKSSRAPDVPSRAVDLSAMRPLQRARAKTSSGTLKIKKCSTSSLDEPSITGSLASTICHENES